MKVFSRGREGGEATGQVENFDFSGLLETRFGVEYGSKFSTSPQAKFENSDFANVEQGLLCFGQLLGSPSFHCQSF